MSATTATYPLPRLESGLPSTTAAGQARRFGFWGTLGWYALSEVTFVAAGFAAAFGYAVWWGLARRGIPLDVETPLLDNLSAAVGITAAALVVVLAARRRSASVCDYLGLVWPHWRDVLLGLGLLAALWGALSGLEVLFPSTSAGEATSSEYRSVLGNPAALALFWIATVVTAPIGEEIIYRGFLLRGWSGTQLGMVGALLLSSLVFAAGHLQYDLRGMAEVFAIGLAFGVMRWKSGSTVLAIVLHAVWNLSVSVLVVLST